MSKIRSGKRTRLLGVVFLMALAAGCGGGGESGAGIAPPPPAAPPTPPEVRGWANPFPSAAVVLGQSRFDQIEDEGSPSPTTKLFYPKGSPAVSSDGKLYVVANGEVYVFNSYDAMNGPVADSSFVPVNLGVEVYPQSLSIQGERAVVTTGNDLVLVYDAVPTQGMEPFAIAGGGVGCSPTGLSAPTAAYWTSTDRLIVVDSNHNRVLIWDDVSNRAGALGDPNVVLGQRNVHTCGENDDDTDPDTDPSPTGRTMYRPTGVWSDGVRLIVSDSGNNRVLVWDDIRSVASFEYADHVIGQQDSFSSAPNAGQTAPSASTLSNPGFMDVSEAGELALADTLNSRVLIWKRLPTSDGQAADFVVGQSDFVHGAPNDRDQTGQPGTAPSAKTLFNPEGARFHGRNLIVNDTENHRVLVWRESN